MLLRFCAFIFVSCLFSLQGCNTSKKKEAPSGADALGKPASTTPFEIRGRVNSGSLLSTETVSLISLHPVTAGQVNLDVSASESISDTSGIFTLTVAAKYIGQPAVIRAFVSGVGVELLLSVPALSPKHVNNITLLTHLATSRFLESSSLGSTTQASVAISDVNTQVASRFGVIGDLPSLALVNTNAVEEWAQSNSFSIRYSALGRATIEAVQNDAPDLPIWDAVKVFTQDYIKFGLVDNSSIEAVTSYAEILSELQFILSSMKLEAENVVLDRLAIEVATELGLAQVDVSDQYRKGFSASGSGLSFVEKAKGLVRDMRQIVSSIDIGSIVGLSNISKLLGNDDPLTDQLKGFGIQVNVSELISGEDFEHIQTALKMSSLAVVKNLACYYDAEICEEESEPSLSKVNVYHAFQQVSESRQVVRSIHEFTVTQDLDVCEENPEPCIVSIDLSLHLDLTALSFGLNDGSSLPNVFIDSGEITLNGVISQGDLEFEVRSEQPQLTLGKTAITFDIIEDDQEVYESIVIATANTNVVLPTSLKKSNTQNMLATLDLSVDTARIELNDTITKRTYEYRTTATTVSDTVVKQLQGLKVNVAGVVNSLEEENFLVSINFAQPGKGFEGDVIYQQTTVEDCGTFAGEFDCIKTELDSSFEGELDDVAASGVSGFIKLDASIGYKAILQGVADPVIVQLSGSRESSDVNTINGLTVAYPGHSLHLHGQFNSKGKVVSMGATNLEGITMAVETREKGKRYGFLRAPDGTQLAEITPTTDMVQITFEDGYFTSLIL